jgi:hypothetical protein
MSTERHGRVGEVTTTPRNSRCAVHDVCRAIPPVQSSCAHSLCTRSILLRAGLLFAPVRELDPENRPGRNVGRKCFVSASREPGGICVHPVWQLAKFMFSTAWRFGILDCGRAVSGLPYGRCDADSLVLQSTVVRRGVAGELVGLVAAQTLQHTAELYHSFH